MSVKHSVLAILAVEPTVGYQIKKRFEDLTVGLWPLNDGQVYTTLARLERDGLVEERAGDDGQRFYHLTEFGRSELVSWMMLPRAPVADRDELTLKVAFALRQPDLLPAAGLLELVDAQRELVQVSLRRLTRLKAGLGDVPEDRPQAMVVEAAVQRLTAELRWLDTLEASVSGEHA